MRDYRYGWVGEDEIALPLNEHNFAFGGDVISGAINQQFRVMEVC